MLVGCIFISYVGLAQHVVISEVYGGGGNSGATYKNDFIELYNPTNAAISLTGWSVQYASATGTAWQVTNLTGTISSKGFYLVQQAAGTGGTTNLPTPDVIGTVNMSGTTGKVALCNVTTALSGANPTGASIVDLVGFGTANGFEGAVGSAPSNTTSIERKANSASTAITMGGGGIDEFLGNGQDSDNNANDFIVRAPQPQNSASSLEPLIIDTTPPTFISGFPTSANILQSQFDLLVQLDEIGTAYYVVLANGAAQPSSAQVKLGQDNGGLAVSLSGSFSVPIANTSTTKIITGLTSSTSYDVYVVAQDGVPNLQALPVKTTVTTSGVVAPIISTSLTSINFLALTDKSKQSSPQTYTVSASDLTNDLALSIAGNFLLSFDNVNYTSSLSIAKALFASAQTIYVKFSPSGNIGAQSGTITHTSSGASDKAVTLSATAIDPFNQNFNDPAFLTNSGWSQFSKVGAQVWASTNFGRTCLTGCNAGTLDKAAQINGFSAGAKDNEDWLISPLLDMTGFVNFPAFSFWTISAFAGDGLQLKYSSNYSGTGDPTLATWTSIDGKFPASNSALWTQSSNIILPKSAIYVAVVYTSNTIAASRWTFDDWQVADVASYIDVPAIAYSFGEISAGNLSASKNFSFTSIGYGDITVTPSAGYQVSDDNTNFSASQMVLAADAAVGKTIYVRFSPAIKQLKWDGSINFKGTGLDANYGTLSGTSYPKSETFDIVCYNLEFFGTDVKDTSGKEFGPVDDALQIANVTTVLQNINADIYGVEEIADDNAFNTLVANLPGYDKIVSDRWSYSFTAPDPNFPPQKIGFIYNTSAVQVVSSRVMFAKLYDDVRTGNTSLLPGYPTTGGNTPANFWSSGRLPFMVTFDVTIDGFKKRVRAVVIHAKSGSAQADYDRRKYDVKVLRDSLVANYANDNIILVGDYNDDVDVSIAAPTNTESTFKSFVDDVANFNSLTYTISQAGAVSFPNSSSFLDHIITSNELTNAYVPNSIAIEDARAYVSNYINTTSDHLPVSARFLLSVKTDQTITFNALPAKTFGDAVFALSASSTSGLPITYASSDPTVASISGNIVTILKPGTVTITASQTGDNSYNSAASVDQSLVINPPPVPTITTFTPSTSEVGTTVTITGTNFNTTTANNIVIFGATQATVTAATSTQLTVTVPTGATYAPITVLNSATSLLTYSISNFTPTFTPNKGSITASDFENKVDFVTGTNPRSVAIGDLDGDGKADLVVPNGFSNSVSVFRNTGNSGTVNYAVKIDFPTGTNPYSVAIGDLDGDGKADLAAANGNSNTISVFLNTGSKGAVSYATKMDFPAGTSPYSVAIGDLDGDGKADLAVVNSAGNSVSVLRNTSSRDMISYATKVDFATGLFPTNVAIGDLDGDGKVDLAVANYGDNTVSVLRNTSSIGAIGYAAKVDFVVGTYPNSVAIGDLNGDGKTDLAVANISSNSVSVLRNTGNIGTVNYAAKVDFSTGQNPNSVAIGDLDGDGKVDLAVANFSSQTVSILRNMSSGATVSFASKVDFTTGPGSVSAVIGDLDGDGKADMVVANNTGNSISIIRNNPAFPPIITSFTPASGTIGTMVIITGTNFDPIPTNNAVKFNGVLASVTASTATTITAMVPVGAITGSLSVTVNGQTAISAQSFTFVKAIQTIIFNTLSTKTFGDAAFALSAISSSTLPISFSSSDATVASIAGNTVTILKAGTVNITASQAGDASFNAATSVVQPLTINKANQVITFTAIPDKLLSDAAFTIAATSTSGLAVVLTPNAKVSIAGNQVTIVSAGKASITASQSGNGNYNAATSVIREFCIKPAKPSVTVSLVGSTPTLTSSAASGNQWFLNGASIPSATNSSYIATTAGAYKVQVTIDNCVSDFSADVPVVITGDLSTINSTITAYPNPADDRLIIMGLEEETKECKVIDLLGRATALSLTKQKGGHEASVENFSSGVYLVRVQQSNAVQQIRFLKK